MITGMDPIFKSILDFWYGQMIMISTLSVKKRTRNNPWKSKAKNSLSQYCFYAAINRRLLLL